MRDMAFIKSFPKTTNKSPYPKWEEVKLDPEEEQEAEFRARMKNIEIMKQCMEDAMRIFNEKSLKRYQTDLISVSIALFEKRASHEIFWKESKAKEKFDINP